MVRIEDPQAAQPVITADEWQLIVSAIGAYSHNKQYKDLESRLKHVKVGAGSIAMLYVRSSR